MRNFDIEPKPIDTIEAFVKWGDTFTRTAYNKEKDIFVFERRTPEGKLVAWEVVKPRIRNGVRCYPSTAEFGMYGKCVSGTERMRPRMEHLLQNGW